MAKAAQTKLTSERPAFSAQIREQGNESHRANLKERMTQFRTEQASVNSKKIEGGEVLRPIRTGELAPQHGPRVQGDALERAVIPQSTHEAAHEYQKGREASRQLSQLETKSPEAAAAGKKLATESGIVQKQPLAEAHVPKQSTPLPQQVAVVAAANAPRAGKTEHASKGDRAPAPKQGTAAKAKTPAGPADQADPAKKTLQPEAAPKQAAVVPGAPAPVVAHDVQPGARIEGSESQGDGEDGEVEKKGQDRDTSSFLKGLPTGRQRQNRLETLIGGSAGEKDQGAQDGGEATPAIALSVDHPKAPEIPATDPFTTFVGEEEPAPEGTKDPVSTVRVFRRYVLKPQDESKLKWADKLNRELGRDFSNMFKTESFTKRFIGNVEWARDIVAHAGRGQNGGYSA